MKIENEHNFVEALKRGLNLFCGAGFSVLAKDSLGKPLPVGDSLKKELIMHFKCENLESLDLPKLWVILEQKFRDELRNYIESRYRVCHYDPRYDSLPNVNIKTIFTTNIDDLIYKIYANSDHHYLNDLDIKGSTFNEKNAIDIVTLHGSVVDPKRNYKFSDSDIATAFRNDPDRWYFLTQRLQANPTLFWGYALNDAGTIESLSPNTIKGRQHQDKWITIRDNTESGLIEYYKAQNFQTIIADTGELLDYLKCFSTQIPTSTANNIDKIENLFPDLMIPNPIRVPVRPLKDFYSGAAPMWSDVFSGNLHKTQYHAKIRNSINSKRHTVVIGMVASGKSTLLMQVANDIKYDGYKFITSYMSLEKAKLIHKNLNSRNAIIFIDNFSDSIDAFQYLAKQSNILLIAFDRNYHYEFISHKIDKKKCNLLEVTTLTNYDVSQIVSKIPNDIRNHSVNPGIQGSHQDNSLFETVEKNIKGPKLRERFKVMLKGLSLSDANAVQYLLVCCYTHRCRTPISMDMLMAFFRDSLNDITEIYKIGDRLRAMIIDYSGELDDGAQDYFAARSNVFAETIIDIAPHDELKKMIMIFYKDVSVYRIHRYDIFKRYAIDAGLMSKVFDDWKEGFSFYDEAFNRDSSPYARQQGALYLAGKHRYAEAFRWIDEAITYSGGKIASIRHSHAIILFNANYRQEKDVQGLLQKSMNILSECYNYDKRKMYHAVTYAEQAIKYYKKYSDKSYLSEAKTWLEEEIKTSPWHWKANQLRKDIELIIIEQ